MPTALMVKQPHSPHASSLVGRGSWVQGVGNQWEMRSGVREEEDGEEEEEEEEGRERRASAGAEAVMEAVVVAAVEAEAAVLGGGESGIPAQNSRKTTSRRI